LNNYITDTPKKSRLWPVDNSRSSTLPQANATKKH